MSYSAYPHRRYNPLADEWVLVSPQRTQRPWQGQTEKAAPADQTAYDPQCYLCPGNERAGGKRNPDYRGPYVFTNDFSALLSDTPKEADYSDPLFTAATERGLCEVICFTPRHDLTLPRMPLGDIERLIDVWKERYIALGSRPEISHVQIFENRGAMMGCSNPHPHGQIWATESLPELPAKEDRAQRAYREKNGRCLLCAYVEKEIAKGDRLIFQNDSFVALVPFWALWPFETMIIPLRHIPSLKAFTQKDRADLADILKRLGTRYDNLFQCPFPYSMGFHQAPFTGLQDSEKPDVLERERDEAWHFHIHYFPPLLRSASVRKFMVGFELLAMPQRDITAEAAADSLRALSETHYMETLS